MNKPFKQLLPMYMIIFISFLAYSMTIILFVPMLMDKSSGFLSFAASTGYRTALAGVVIAMYPLGQFFGSPVIGKLADRFGRKKVISVSLVLGTIGYVLVAISVQFQWLDLLFVSLFFTGLCEANMAIAQSVVADVSSPAERGKYIGYTYTLCALGYAVGPLFGGLLAQYVDYAFPFFVMAVLLLATLFYLQRCFVETFQPKNQKINYLETFSNLLTIFTDKALRRMYLINFLMFFALFGFYRGYLMYMIDEWHLSVHVAGFVYSAGAVSALISSLYFMGPLSKWMGLRKLSITSILLCGVGFLVLTLPKSFPLFIVLMLIVVAITLLSLSGFTALLSTMTDEDNQGRVLGNNQALQVSAEAISAATVGVIAAMAVHLSLIVMGVIAIVTGLLLLVSRFATLVPGTNVA